MHCKVRSIQLVLTKNEMQNINIYILTYTFGAICLFPDVQNIHLASRCFILWALVWSFIGVCCAWAVEWFTCFCWRFCSLASKSYGNNRSKNIRMHMRKRNSRKWDVKRRMEMRWHQIWTQVVNVGAQQSEHTPASPPQDLTPRVPHTDH